MNGMPREPRLQRARLPQAQREGLTAAILGRTSGPACQRAAALIAGSPEEPQSGASAALLAGHLEHCASCRRLAATIQDARVALASMVEFEPEPTLVPAVLLRTTARRKWAAGRRWLGAASAWELSAGWRDRAVDTWQRVLARPRLSLELAYLATVLVVVLVGNPSLIAEKLGARTSATVGQAAEVGTGRTAGTALPGGAAPRDETTTPAWMEPARRELASGQQAAARSWNWLADRVSRAFDASWNWLADVFRWLGDRLGLAKPTEPPAPAVRE